jgi:hypothetical protein
VTFVARLWLRLGRRRCGKCVSKSSRRRPMPVTHSSTSLAYCSQRRHTAVHEQQGAGDRAFAWVSDHRAAPMCPPELFSRALHNFAAGAPPNRDWLLSVPLSDLRRTVRQRRRRADNGLHPNRCSGLAADPPSYRQVLHGTYRAGYGVLAYSSPQGPGASTICMRWPLMIEAEQLLRVVVQDLIGDFLRQAEPLDIGKGLPVDFPVLQHRIVAAGHDVIGAECFERA